MKATNTNTHPITLEQIQDLFGGTLAANSQYADAECDRVLTSIDLGPSGGLAAIQIVLNPSAPDGVQVIGPAKVRADCDDIVRDGLNLPRQPRAKPAND